jgi:hypothetical protein
MRRNAKTEERAAPYLERWELSELDPPEGFRIFGSYTLMSDKRETNPPATTLSAAGA